VAPQRANNRNLKIETKITFTIQISRSDFRFTAERAKFDFSDFVDCERRLM
jgi:hypothetical protein